jgi:transposase
MFAVRWLSHSIKKRAVVAASEKVKWQRRKRAKTVDNLVICDWAALRNTYNILAISDCIKGNYLGGIPHDSYEIIENVQNMTVSMEKKSIDYHFSHLNADSGFDVKSFLAFIEHVEMTSIIKQNKRNTKKTEQTYRYMSDYIYKNRFKIEVVFAWLDTYKKILVRFEKLAVNFKSWLNIASTMINFRHIFN